MGPKDKVMRAVDFFRIFLFFFFFFTSRNNLILTNHLVTLHWLFKRCIGLSAGWKQHTVDTRCKKQWSYPLDNDSSLQCLVPIHPLNNWGLGPDLIAGINLVFTEERYWELGYKEILYL